MSVAPPSVPVVAAAQQAATAAVLATVIEATQTFENLPVGSLLNASITGKDASGLLLMRGDTGPLVLRTGAALPESGKLLMQVLSAGSSPQLRLLALDGLPLLPPTTGPMDKAAGMEMIMRQAANFAASRGLSLAPFAGLADQVELGLTGGGLAARVVQSEAPPFAGQNLFEPGRTLAPLPAGSLLTVRLYDIRPPEPGAANPQSPAASNGIAQSALVSDPVMAGAKPAQPGQPAFPAALPGTPQAAPSIAPQASAMPSPAGPGTAQLPLPEAGVPSDRTILTGIVQHQGAGGHVLVRTGIGLLDMNPPVALTTGSLLTLEVAAVAPPAQPATQAPQATQAWPVLEEALNALESANPDAARQMAALLPQAGPRLAASMAVFVTALRAGDLRSVIGPQALQALEKTVGKEGVKKLEEEFKSAGGRSRGAASASGNWNAYALPFINGGQIEAIRLHVRPPPPEETDAEGAGGKRRGGGTRFVLDVTLSRLGRLQLDGLVRRPGAFDLIFRSEKALSPEMRADIARIFAEVGAASGINGGITFQAGERTLIDLGAPHAAEGAGRAGLMV